MLGDDHRLREMGEIAEEHQLRFVEGGLQSLQEQPPIQSRQNPDGEEEVWLAADLRNDARRSRTMSDWVLSRSVSIEMIRRRRQSSEANRSTSSRSTAVRAS
jgi:hypothetical protein